MENDLISFALTAFATLLVTIGPHESAAVYASLTSGVHKPQRANLAWRCVFIAGILLLAFALGGNQILEVLNISMPAFRFAGGVLLFLGAVSLVFEKRDGMSSITAAEKQEALGPGDIAIFPLAFPLIAGPGSLTAVVLLTGRAAFEPLRMAIVIAALICCLLLTYLALRVAEQLTRLLGVTGADVVGRVSGIILASLAAQFVFDGIREAHLFSA